MHCVRLYEGRFTSPLGLKPNMARLAMPILTPPCHSATPPLTECVNMSIPVVEPPYTHLFDMRTNLRTSTLQLSSLPGNRRSSGPFHQYPTLPRVRLKNKHRQPAVCVSHQGNGAPDTRGSIHDS
jgi:hypothetical protein